MGSRIVSCLEHVIGEEKYECEMLNNVVIESRMLVGRVCCDVFCLFLFEVLCLYILYSHIISILIDCRGGTSTCLLYMATLYFFHSHFSLVVEMVVRYLLVLLYVGYFISCLYGIAISYYVFFWITF